MPLPEAFGQVFDFWLKDRPRGALAFAQHPGGKLPTAQAARAYFRRLRQRTNIAMPITPHKLRHTDATNLLNAGAERVDLQALLGHERINTTQIDTHVGPERLEQGVARL